MRYVNVSLSFFSPWYEKKNLQHFHYPFMLLVKALTPKLVCWRFPSDSSRNLRGQDSPFRFPMVTARFDSVAIRGLWIVLINATL
jgi:hypothetical protein